MPRNPQQPVTFSQSSTPNPSQYSLPSPWQNLKGTGMDESIKALLVTIFIVPLSLLAAWFVLFVLYQSVTFFEVRTSASDQGYSVTQDDVKTFSY